MADAGRRGLTAPGAEVAVDATGLDTRYASRHPVNRTGRRRFTRLARKLTVACHTASHLLAGAVFGRRPSQDSPHLPAAVRQAVRHLRVGRPLGDAAYDAEHNHVLCRDRLGIPESIFRLHPRNAGRKWLRSPYRRSMTRSFPRSAYHQRWQVESAFSRHKRLLGPFLRSRSRPAQKVESQLRVLTHNLMLLAA